MPTKCCVPLCKGNYKTGPKVSVFSFPKDEEIKQKWLKVIQRADFYPTKTSRVCEAHFKASDFEMNSSAFDEKTGEIISVPLQIRRLKKEAVPSVFPNYPSSSTSNLLAPRKDPEERWTEKEMFNIKQAINASMDSYKEYNENRKIMCLNDILKCIKCFGISKYWSVYNPDLQAVYLIHIEPHPEPFIQHSIKIDESLNLNVCFEKCPISKLSNFSFPHKISHFNDIIHILEFIENNCCIKKSSSNIKSVIDIIINLLNTISSEENESNIKFIQEQLKLLISQSNNFRYSTDLLIFASILRTISPHAYKFIRHSSNIILPHPHTLQKICNNLSISPNLEMLDENFLMYITNRISYINDHEKFVVLLLDEIHIKPLFDYKGGSIVGAAFNSDKAATSAFVFMISSILSPFKEVVHIMPVCSINSQVLHDAIKKVIIGLENIGLKVVCIVTDNNAINVKSLSLFMGTPERSFVYPHPVDANRPLFFLIDSVHLFKSIRNNWLNQKNFGTCFFYPDFENPSNPKFCTASFIALKKIHEIENNQIVKYAIGLTLKSLCPSNLERQNVGLVLKIFNKFVIQGLLKLGPLHKISEFEGTANFISIICRWWDIFNVKTTTKGIHQRSAFMAPLTTDKSDEKYVFLKKFLDWLDAWERMNCSTGSLSKETHKALIQTIHGMLQFTEYCIEECKMKYILPGKIQTDCLEARFGKYRQLAGSQYHISMRQLLECEKKLRLQSCVKLELLMKSRVVQLINFESPEDFNDLIHLKENNLKKFPSFIFNNSEISNAKPYLPVLTYLGGYCSYSVLKKLKCNNCKENLTLDYNVNLDESYNLIKDLDHGGLKCPTQFVVSIVLHNYLVVNKLYSEVENFMQQHNQKNFVVNVTFNTLKDREIVMEEDCMNGHDGDYVCKLLLYVSTNIMLKNLCSQKNDILKNKSNVKKRKLEILKK